MKSKSEHIVYTGNTATICIEVKNPDLLAMAMNAARATGLTIPEIANAAFITKVRQFEEQGCITFGPGKAQK